MFALSKIAVVDKATIHIKDADGAKQYGDDKQPVTITVHSPGSAGAEHAKDEQLKRALDRRKRKGDRPMTGAELRDETAEYLADMTDSASQNWSLTEDGAPLTSHDDFKALYLTSNLGFIKDQVATEIGDWGNFTQSSETI